MKTPSVSAILAYLLLAPLAAQARFEPRSTRVVPQAALATHSVVAADLDRGRLLYTIHCAPWQECTSMQAMSHLQAGSYLAALLIVVLALSALAFRRQDV